MERMSGVPVDEFDELRERGIDGELVIRRGAKAWLEAVVEHGPFHGDMHAGNIWVLDDGRSSFLDFGIMGELPGEWRRVFRDLVMTIAVDRNWTRVVRGYRDLGILPEGVGADEELAMALGAMMEPMLDLTASETSLGESLKASIELSEQLGATTSPKELVLVIKQLMYIERYIKGLAPDYVLVNDPYVIKNIFPEHAIRRAAELGVTFPE
jgi:predicted unusual protein kinase regulating ubiquinone biosynthesis (AarF/ABC1/UbiB family)